VFINDFNKLKDFRRRIEPPRSIEQEAEEIEALYNTTLGEIDPVINDNVVTNKAFVKNSSHAEGLDCPRDSVYYEMKIKDLENTINAFYDSNGGRLLLRYYKYRDQFIRPDSLTKKFIDFCLWLVKKI
jgi:hypothetical protein